jgi:hypothetical protein
MKYNVTDLLTIECSPPFSYLMFQEHEYSPRRSFPVTFNIRASFAYSESPYYVAAVWNGVYNAKKKGDNIHKILYRIFLATVKNISKNFSR